MDDLVTWLHAAYDEDERVARETPEESRTWSHKSFVDYSAPDLPMDDHTLWFGDRVVGEVGFGDGEILPDEAEHIARHDPARVLAEVDAKRRILDEHPPIREPYGWAGRCQRCIDGDDPWAKEAEWPCLTVRLLALPYADWPGYRPEWAPDRTD